MSKRQFEAGSGAQSCGETDLVGYGDFLPPVFGDDLADGRPVVSFEGNPASMTSNALTDSSTEHMEGGKGGEGGVYEVTSADFVAAVFPQLPEGAFAAACPRRPPKFPHPWPPQIPPPEHR